MVRSRWIALSLLLLSGTACFHQVVQTGSPASTTVVDKPFVSTWLWGLVEAKPIDLRAQCPQGAAKIETETSFVNGLVGAVTLGIYTPQHVRVTCASRIAAAPVGSKTIDVDSAASAAQVEQALAAAVAESLERDVTILLRF